jgi:hypothetical protein
MTGAKHTGPKTKEGVMAVQRETARRLLAGGGNIGGYGGVGSETDRTHEETDKGGAEMNGEIDNNFYCTGDNFISETATCCMGKKGCIRLECKYCHRKWPAPEQYKEEYGGEYPEDGAAYYMAGSSTGPLVFMEGVWRAGSLMQALHYAKNLKANRGPKKYDVCIVCACTPWSVPPYDYRP